MIFNKILAVIDRSTPFPEIHLINFLVSSGKTEAIDVLFHKIRTTKPTVTQIEKVARALQEIYPQHHEMINHHIDDLLRSDDETLLELGSQIRPYLIP